MGTISTKGGAESLRDLLDTGGRLGLLIVGGISLVWPEWVAQPLVQWAPWALALVCFGLAHGGIDHRLSWKRGPGGGERSHPASPLFYLGYLGAMGATLWLWWVSATVGWLFFLAISVYHFGQGDLYWSQRFGLLARLEPGRAKRGYGALFLLIRGTLPVLLPLFFFAEEFQGIARAVGVDWQIGPFGIGRWGWWGALGIQLGGALLLIRKAGQTSGAQSGASRAALVEGGETLLLLWLVSLTPPILSIGTYFLCWHSPRHVARLVELMPALRQRLERQGNPLVALVAYHRAAAPMTFAATLLFLLLWWGSVQWGVSVSKLVGPAIFFISAITVPHVLIVSRLDHSQQIWGEAFPGSTFEGGVE